MRGYPKTDFHNFSSTWELTLFFIQNFQVISKFAWLDEEYGSNVKHCLVFRKIRPCLIVGSELGISCLLVGIGIPTSRLNLGIGISEPILLRKQFVAVERWEMSGAL